MADFAERIKSLREERKLSQDAIGQQIGVKRYSVYTYEKGKGFPDVPHLISLAEFFDVSIDYLVGRTDNREVNR